MNPQVLIVGAGPTGMVLALALARRGIAVRIVDRNSGPGQTSRAMVVQARTLEFYQQFGFANDVVRQGIPVKALHIRDEHHETAVLKFTDLGQNLSPFPFALSYPQDDHEVFLQQQLRQVGVTVEWQTELVSFELMRDGVRARLHTDETIDVDYLCGCDGVHSVVRERLGVHFPGGTYDELFYVTDVQAAGVTIDNDLHICLGQRLFTAAFPVRHPGLARLIGIVPPELRQTDPLTFDLLRSHVEALLDLRVDRVNWFSTYHVHRRVAEHFGLGRVFLAGDAAHVHSPAGGQGMNTGIGDAINLAWKLSDVLHGVHPPALLDTYEIERLRFARGLVASTDRLFEVMVGTTPEQRFLRNQIVPHLLPFLMGFAAVRRAAFRLASQIRVEYHESPLSRGSAADVHGGDRLPWVQEPDNFTSLNSLNWQVHVYGQVESTVLDIARQHDVPLHQFPWTADAEAAGLAPDGIYLVRPDGYVGLATTRPTDLDRYFERWRATALQR